MFIIVSYMSERGKQGLSTTVLQETVTRYQKCGKCKGAGELQTGLEVWWKLSAGAAKFSLLLLFCLGVPCMS